MQWQEKVLNRISEDSSRPQIVVDETGVLRQDDFINYLITEEINYCVIDSVHELVRIQKEKYSLIICPHIDVPSYLENQYELINFLWMMLPVNIEPELYNKISVSDVILLLEYTNESPVSYINKTNLDKILLQANVFKKKKKRTALEEEINFLLKPDISISLILKSGILWGEYLLYCYQLELNPDKDIMMKMDNAVSDFILSKGLKETYYYPVNQNISVDKILPFIKQSNFHKIALICFDGMGWAEWLILQQHLTKKGFKFNVSPQFALVPTITSISRTAIFSGSYNLGFEKYPNDRKHFIDYWQAGESAFIEEDSLKSKELLVGIKYVGMIYSFFDKLAHGMSFPKDSESKKIYFDSINSYLRESRVEDTLKILSDDGFKIFICSDHGSVLATGNGKKIEKYLIDKNSKRATIIDKSILNKFIEEQKYEIPFVENKIVVFAKNRELFSTKDKIALSHGGVTVEELVVPFIEVIS